MEFAKLLLEYIKTLIWPIILLVVVFSYEKDVISLLNDRELDQVQQASEGLALIQDRTVSKLVVTAAERAGFEAILDAILT